MIYLWSIDDNFIFYKEKDNLALKFIYFFNVVLDKSITKIMHSVLIGPLLKWLTLSEGIFCV